MLNTVVHSTRTGGTFPAASGNFPMVLRACAGHAVADDILHIGPSSQGEGLPFPLRGGALGQSLGRGAR